MSETGHTAGYGAADIELQFTAVHRRPGLAGTLLAPAFRVLNERGRPQVTAGSGRRERRFPGRCCGSWVPGAMAVKCSTTAGTEGSEPNPRHVRHSWDATQPPIEPRGNTAGHISKTNLSRGGL
jgi:hypothetical protein